jgi:hypothetical protein
LNATAEPSRRVHQEILYADQLWRQQRFFAGFLILIGLFMLGVLIYDREITQVGTEISLAITKGEVYALGPSVWLLYVPAGLLLGAGFIYYKRRSFVEPVEDGLKVSTLRHSVLIAYDDIRQVRVQPLKLAFLDARSRMVAPMMKGLLDKPALFVRIKVDEDQSGLILKRLGRRMMYEDTIALPIHDADAVAWEINARLPERIGQNQGGAKRRKRRR